MTDEEYLELAHWNNIIVRTSVIGRHLLGKDLTKRILLILEDCV